MSAAAIPHAPAPRARRRHWLTPERLKAYALIVLAAEACLALIWLASMSAGVDAVGKPVGYDFITFWSASALTLQGDAAASYDPARILAASHLAVPANRAAFIWSYPPIFHLVVLPLALFPYLVSYGLWSVLNFASYLAVVRRLAPASLALWPAIAYPGAFLNLVQGQNGGLTAALFGASLLWLERRPRLAGVLIGLLSYKPHLGVLLPVALLCGRRWQTLGAAAITTVALAGLSAAVLGPAAWLAFADNLAFAGQALDGGALPLHKMPSVFASLRLLEVPSSLALALHVLVALTAGVLVGWLWWRRAPLPLASAALVIGSLLVPPHINDHDLALLALPLALLASEGHRRGWWAGEREILVLAWLSPLLAAPLALHFGIQIALPLLAMLLAIAARRACSTPDRPLPDRAGGATLLLDSPPEPDAWPRGRHPASSPAGSACRRTPSAVFSTSTTART